MSKRIKRPELSLDLITVAETAILMRTNERNVRALVGSGELDAYVTVHERLHPESHRANAGYLLYRPQVIDYMLSRKVQPMVAS